MVVIVGRGRPWNVAPETPRSGVIGLTTAIEIQERGKGKYRVTIVSDVFPGDQNTGVNYTSQWAGANHIFDPRDKKNYPNDELFDYQKDTFKTFWEFSEEGKETEHLFQRIPHTTYHWDNHLTENSPGPDTSGAYSSYKVIPSSELPDGAVSGCTFETVTIDVPEYLKWLQARFIALGGKIVRRHVQHLVEIIEGRQGMTEEGTTDNPVGKAHAVLVCTGLSTRSLGGVEDLTVRPLRGQVILLRAPWVKFGLTARGLGVDENGQEIIIYVIPRRNGEVVVGGTRILDDWYPYPRKETTLKILSRAIKIRPQLAPEEVRSVREPSVKDLLPLVIREQCGFRPQRDNGIRLEKEWWNVQGKLLNENQNHRSQGDTLIVYNYGHSGSGYQSSWGTARRAADLLEEGLIY
ncbi:hypothetical protein Agabi119p4_9397 [Agaricus bisporus var. burnettii]|uniref:FAD dependent oxidoreductase domain-containing protein n=1 Tax=Agaricus bisporus var. burnettii TaxID=192524 RepID=A0A8H7C3L0_AGABI|nr:hypothetical protein Agabi119p4_9397 [Agaricus bisporus var. burnettii]